MEVDDVVSLDEEETPGGYPAPGPSRHSVCPRQYTSIEVRAMLTSEADKDRVVCRFKNPASVTSEAWDSFTQVFVDDVEQELVQCVVCQCLLRHTSGREGSGTGSMKRHLAVHAKRKLKGDKQQSLLGIKKTLLVGLKEAEKQKLSKALAMVCALGIRPMSLFEDDDDLPSDPVQAMEEEEEEEEEEPTAAPIGSALFPDLERVLDETEAEAEEAAPRDDELGLVETAPPVPSYCDAPPPRPEGVQVSAITAGQRCGLDSVDGRDISPRPEIVTTDSARHEADEHKPEEDDPMEHDPTWKPSHSPSPSRHGSGRGRGRGNGHGNARGKIRGRCRCEGFPVPIQPAARASETRLGAEAQDGSIVTTSHGMQGDSECDPLPGGPTLPLQSTAEGHTPCGTRKRTLHIPTSGQCGSVSSSSTRSVRESAVYERLLREGSPRLTLRDHKSYLYGMHTPSAVWKNFKCVYVDGKEQMFSACIKCQSVMSHNPRTGKGAMTRHIKVFHTANRITDSDSSELMPIPSMPEVDFRKLSEARLVEVRADLATAVSKCCYMDIRPYHSLQGGGFKHLAQALINLGAMYWSARAEDVLPSESTVSRCTEDAAEELRVKLKSQLKEVQTTIGVTTDLWEMKQTGAYYVTVTAQYVDDSFTLQLVVLATKLFSEKHTGVKIMTFTTEVLDSLGIDSSKCQLTTDSASNDDSASSSIDFLICSAHNIDLVLTHAFDEVTRDSLYEGIDETLQSCAELVTHMKRSGLNAALTSKLVLQQEDTRWISKLAMLKSVAEAFPELLEKFTDKEEVMDRLLKVDLDLLKELVRILDPFREASDILQAEKGPTIHLVVKCANKLRRGLTEGSSDKLDEAQSTHVQLVKKRLAENIHRLRIEPLHLAAHALQPDWRLKSYGDWADVREGHRVLLARATEGAASIVSEEEAQKSRPERVARVRTNTFLDSDSSDEEQMIDDPTQAARARRELDAYLLAPGGEGQDILSYWRKKEDDLPLLAKVAKSLLAIPASTTSLERSVSTAGRVIGKRRTQLSPNSADALLFLNSQVNRELQTRSQEINDATSDGCQFDL